MRYSKFEIKNFKGIKNLTIDLEKDPKSKVFTLVGLNESGKTSILEAINTFSENYSLVDRHKLIPKSEKINFNGSVLIRAYITVNDSDNQKISEFVKTLGYKYFNPIKSFSITKEYNFINSNFNKFSSNWNIKYSIVKNSKSIDVPFIKDQPDCEWQIITKFIINNLIPKIIYYQNFLFDFPDKIYINEISSEMGQDENFEIEQNNFKNVVQDILFSIDSELKVKEHLLDRMIIDSSSNSEALEHTLSSMSAKVSQVVFNAWAKLFNSHGKEIIIKAGSDKKEELIRYFLEFKLKEGASIYSVSERSLGFKWFFTFLLFTEFRKNRITESGELLFLLDEPASNLHSTAQKNLLKTFEELISKSTLIYTTHSHHLINPDWLNGVYIVKNKGLNYKNELTYDSNKTDIEATIYKQFVSSYPDQREYFQPVLDTLDYQPGLLEKIPNIIITEGKNEYFTFKYLNDLYFDCKFSSVNFYPGGGANSNFIIIRLYLAWERPFCILLDSDKAGVKAKKDYEKEFTTAIIDKIYCYSDFDQKLQGLATEDLFSEPEKLLITKVFDPKSTKFEKGKFNTGLQNLLFRKEKVELCKETLSTFELIFSSLYKGE